MYKYDYTFYNADDGLLFALNYSGAPNFIGNEYYYTYNTSFASLKSEAANATLDTLHSEDYSLYPMAVRYADPAKNFYIIERPPFQIDVDFSTAKSYRQRKSPKYLSTTKIWVPWTVSILSFNVSSQISTNQFTFGIYFNNKPLSSIDEHVLPCYLPNTDYSGRICMGQDSLPVSQIISKDPKDITAIYNAAFNSYFAGWNSDLLPEFYLTPYIKDLICNRISKIKGSPKHYRDFIYSINYVNRFDGSNAKYLSSILYTVSNMSLDEIFQYIESCKEVYEKNPNPNRKTSLKDRLRMYLSSMPTYSLFGMPEQVNDSTYYRSVHSLFKKTNPISSRITVVINGFPDEISSNPADFIDNPYIIHKIYSSLYTQFQSDTPSIGINTITLPYSEVVQYNKDHQNLNNKESEQSVVVSS